MINLTTTPVRENSNDPNSHSDWDYETAFSRHDGLIAQNEQEILRNSRVAIVGMGGVGGVHLMSLARLGVGRFSIADPDHFEVANFNRQYGARTDTISRSKVEVMAEELQRVNPEAEIRCLQGITDENADDFLADADLFIDGIDFFAIEMRRKLFEKAAQKGIFGITAAPLGFGTGWLVFDPEGMSFDEYFDFRDGQTYEDQLIALAVGVAPSLLHRPYIDTSRVDFGSGKVPSSGLGCQMAASVAAPRCFQAQAAPGSG